MKKDNIIPSKKDWGDFSLLDTTLRLDVNYAYERFGGKNNDEMQAAYRENVIERTDDLRWMPLKPFIYYIYGLKTYVDGVDISNRDINEEWLEDYSDVVDCFIELFLDRAKKDTVEIMKIYPDFESLLEYVAEHQMEYGADLDIYGDLKEKSAEIARILSGA